MKKFENENILKYIFTNDLLIYRIIYKIINIIINYYFFLKIIFI